MSPEDIDNVYAYFGRSTKEHSNDFTGCLGIGSKSPFAYVRNFIVVSYYNGVQYTYNVFKNTQGEPEYIKLNEVATTEPNGLKVQFAVKDYECYKFIDAAKHILQFFEHKPTFLNSEIEIEKVEYEYESKYFNVCKDYFSFHDSKVLITMGNIAYSLSQFKSMLLTDDTESEEYKIHQFLTNFDRRSLIFKGDIGLFDFSPSRENISLDPQSFKNIKNFMLEAMDYLRQDLIKKITLLDTEKTYWDALIKFNGLNLFRKHLATAFTRKYYKNNPDCPYLTIIKIPKNIIKYSLKNKRGRSSRYGHSTLVMKEFQDESLDFDAIAESKLVLIDNKTTYVKERIKKFLFNNKDRLKTVYVIYGDGAKNPHDCLDSDYLKEVFQFNKDHYISLNNVELPNRVTSSSGPRNYIKRCECKGHYYDIKSKVLKEGVVDLNEHKIIYYGNKTYKEGMEYIPLINGSIWVNYHMLFNQEDSFYEKIGLNTNGIILIPKLDSSIKKLSKHENCISLKKGLKINIGVDDCYLLSLKSFLNCDSDFMELIKKCDLINNYNKYEELKKEYDSKKYIFHMVEQWSLLFSEYMNEFRNNENIEKAVKNIRKKMRLGLFINDSHEKYYVYYYKNQERDIAKVLEKKIDEAYDKYMNKFKDFACLV
jgi:hypothetical protein